METQVQTKSTEKKCGKLLINEELFETANRTLRELKKRGSTLRIEDLFNDLLVRANEHYWEAQLKKHTPDDYLLELAKQNPEARKYLIQQAKRALDAVDRGESLSKNRKKPGPKPKLGMPEVNQ